MLRHLVRPSVAFCLHWRYACAFSRMRGEGCVGEKSNVHADFHTRRQSPPHMYLDMQEAASHWSPQLIWRIFTSSMLVGVCVSLHAKADTDVGPVRHEYAETRKRQRTHVLTCTIQLGHLYPGAHPRRRQQW